MTLVIMAAGMGSRYGGLKQIDPVTPNGEFIVDFSVYDALRAGFDKVVFIIKEENLKVFSETIGRRVGGAVKVDYAFQNLNYLPEGFILPEGRQKPWGTGHAVLTASDIVHEPFAVINSDDFYGRDAFVKLHDFLAAGHADKAKAHYAMAGYVLENTISENGHVSRGICKVENSLLRRVTERKKIQENDGIIQYNDGGWVDIDRKSVVSMNCWAFTPEIFKALKDGFTEFLSGLYIGSKNTAVADVDPLKAEFFLPFLVQREIDNGSCDVRVLATDAKWYGVTYLEDKPRFVEFIKAQIKSGAYPEKLWK